MKKILSTLLVCALLIGCVLTLASCGKMFAGTYERDFIIYEASYEFKIGGKVILTLDPPVGDDVVYVGTYTINEDNDEITFEFKDEDAKEFGGTRSFSQGVEDGEKYIKLGGVKYTEDD